MTAEAAGRDGSALAARWLSGLVGVPEGELERMRRNGELVALETAAAEPLYPVWQFGPSGVVDGLRRVLAAASETGLDALRLHRLMGARVGMAGGRLGDLLRAGRADHVASVVRAVGAAA